MTRLIDAMDDYCINDGTAYVDERYLTDGRRLDCVYLAGYNESKHGLTRLWLVPNAHEFDSFGTPDPIDVSNWRYLTGEPEWAERFIKVGYFNTDRLALRVEEHLPDELVEELLRLVEYPILDESLWSEVEEEQRDSWWQEDGRREWEKALDPEDDKGLTDDELDALYWHAVNETGEYGDLESGWVCYSEKAMAHMVECAVARMATADRADWGSYR